MRTCYVVPGILGSQLYTGDDATISDRVIWVNLTQLALGLFPALALAPNGVDPLPPHGALCHVGQPLPDYYGTLASTLHADLGPLGYQVRPFGYDWRKAIFGQGEFLAADILNFATPEDPCSIVAHSQGGLVARSAWAILVASGKSNLVRRIVTLGTPHRGSYAPVMVWSLQEELISQLAFACNALGGLIAGDFGIIPAPYTSPLDLTKVTATWPAFYQMLPLIDSLSAIGDPLRPELFQLDNWPADRQLSSLHLSSSSTTWQAFLRNPLSMPPAEVLTTVGGTGRTTPWELRDVEELGDPVAIAMTSSGDTRVTLDSSLVLPGYAAVFPCGHADIINFPSLLSGIAGMVLAERAPGPPPLQPVEDLSNGLVIQFGPPIRGNVTATTFVDCRSGMCSC